jgi:hypothetical protein
MNLGPSLCLSAWSQKEHSHKGTKNTKNNKDVNAVTAEDIAFAAMVRFLKSLRLCDFARTLLPRWSQ